MSGMRVQGLQGRQAIGRNHVSLILWSEVRREEPMADSVGKHAGGCLQREERMDHSQMILCAQ